MLPVRSGGWACAAATPASVCCSGPRTPRHPLPRWHQENPSRRTRPRRGPGCDAAEDGGLTDHPSSRPKRSRRRGGSHDFEEGQHYRVAGLNLLAAIIIYWNTLKLVDAAFARRQAGLELADGVGDGEEATGASRAPSSSSAPGGPPYRLAAAWTGSRGRRRPEVDPPSDALVAPPAWVVRPARRRGRWRFRGDRGPPSRRRQRARARRARCRRRGGGGGIPIPDIFHDNRETYARHARRRSFAHQRRVHLGPGRCHH